MLCNWWSYLITVYMLPWPLSSCLLQYDALAIYFQDHRKLIRSAFRHSLPFGYYYVCLLRFRLRWFFILLLADVCTSEEEIFSFSHGCFLYVLNRGMCSRKLITPLMWGINNESVYKYTFVGLQKDWYVCRLKREGILLKCA